MTEKGLKTTTTATTKQQLNFGCTVSAASATDPCNAEFTTLDNVARSVTEGFGSVCDDSLTEGWYRFLLAGADAVIPTDCVQVKYITVLSVLVRYITI